MTDDGHWDSAWSSALDAMELEADEVEQMLRHRELLERLPADAATFTPPDLGPLPLALEDRARRLMQRQLDLSRELSIAVAGNRQQARLVSRLHREVDQSIPVFLDNRT
ncbi:hypothetical protein GCM10010399_06640 [Dactylosporangium fulvum]|uniref:Uncharacterized protein n=1 Tax=Dactylosporangium fulvum TaxID=53359 RepID=A0ABY5VWF1_9ACTN|nr:hypothetical protein [Dactylosporangium fulvum]UWP81504.1 hypothetical protein Dfulv_41365 [Dactylosporangium fulvum]